MTRKRNTAAAEISTPQAEDAPKAKRGLLLQIPPAQEVQLRRLAEVARIPISKLVAEVESSGLVAEAITEVLRQRHAAWKESLSADIFAEGGGSV